MRETQASEASLLTTIAKERAGRERTLPLLGRNVKSANCLSKNLLESDSLPQLKNLLEISFTIASFRTGEGGERVEVNDGGAESGGEGDGAAISAWAQEREAEDAGRVHGADWLQPIVCAHGVTQLWPARWPARETSGQWAAAGDEPPALRSESVRGAAAHLDDSGFHLWETTGGDHARSAAAIGVLR